MKYLSYLFLSLLFIGCKTYSDDDLVTFDQQINNYIKKNHLKCNKTESGIYYEIEKEGKGDLIQYTDNVSFTYRGELLNGTVFDNQKKPISFNVKDLIAGWKEILLENKPGAKIFMIIPPNLGYGDNDLDDIPKNSVLVFNMEIVSAN